MHMQLLWQRNTIGDLSAEKSPGNEQSTKTSCPSWSWASSREPIAFEQLQWNLNSLKTIRCKILLKSPKYKYGEVVSGHLTVCGYVQQARWTGHLFRNVASDESSGSCSVLPICAVWDSSVGAPPGYYSCLEIGHIGENTCGIILKLSDGQLFKRISYFKYFHNQVESDILEQLVRRNASSKFAWLHAGGLSNITII